MQYNIQINKNLETFYIDKVARQALGSVLLQVGKSVVLATIAKEDKKVEEDFLPLTVQYIEKAYAAGKIPGGYVKRETKPSDIETLNARIIDRSLRPLFPKGYLYPTQITVMILSADCETDLQVISLNAASIALYISGIPIKAPVCGVRIAKINEEFILNPNNQELQKSSLDLYVSGVKDELLMIEMRALPSKDNDTQKMNELSEDETIKALEMAQQAIYEASCIYEKTFAKHKKEIDIELKEQIENNELFEFIEKNYLNDIKNAINQMAKSERASELDKISQKILNFHSNEGWSQEEILNTS